MAANGIMKINGHQRNGNNNQHGNIINNGSSA
jgi:hypothetical protein